MRKASGYSLKRSPRKRKAVSRSRKMAKTMPKTIPRGRNDLVAGVKVAKLA
jgi:hypothetical protein